MNFVFCKKRVSFLFTVSKRLDVRKQGIDGGAIKI